MMRIQYLFLLSLAVILGIKLVAELFMLEGAYLQTKCLKGEIEEIENKKIMDCISCTNFPIERHRKGRIVFEMPDFVLPQQSEQATNSVVDIAIGLWMQQQCIDFQCVNLQDPYQFANQQILRTNGFDLSSKKVKILSVENEGEIFPKISMEYDNQRSQSFLENIVNKLFDTFIPFSLRQQLLYYQGTAIKMRYVDMSENIKPLIKIYNYSENYIDWLILSLLSGITVLIKLNKKSKNKEIQLSPMAVVLFASFISPYLASVISLCVLTISLPAHLVSLLLFMIGLGLNSFRIQVLAAVVSGCYELMKKNRVLSMTQFLIFDAVLIIGGLMEVESYVSMGPCLFYALIQRISTDYESVNSFPKKKNFTLEFEQIQESSL